MNCRKYILGLVARVLLLAGALAYAGPGQAFFFAPVPAFVSTAAATGGIGGNEGGCTVTPGSTTFTSADTFIVPCYNSLQLQVCGGGGGGGTFGSGQVGGTGGTTTAGSLRATGGSGGGASFSGGGTPAGGAGGTASGGQTNDGGASGSPGGTTSAGIGGSGGAGVNGCGSGGAGATIGPTEQSVCGAEGCFDETINFDGGGGGGAGGYSTTTYGAGQLTVGASIICTPGAAGSGKSNDGYTSSAGGVGKCIFTWE